MSKEELGVSGKPDRALSASPTEPVPVSSAGAVTIADAGQWHLDMLRLTPEEWAEARTEVGNTIICSTDGMVSEVLACVIGRNQQERQERAAFIVRACNSHYEMLKAAETVLAHLNERIDIAVQSGADRVPVFKGIVALSDAINRARAQ